MRFLLQIWAMTISVDFYFLLNPSPTLWAAGLLTFKEYCLLARCCCSHFHISTGHKSVTRRIYFSSKLQFKSTQYFWDLNSNILRVPVFPTYCNNPVVPEILKIWSQAINWYHMNCVNQFYHDSQEFNLHVNKKKGSLVNSIRLHLVLADRRLLITYIKSELEVGFEINMSTILYVHKATNPWTNI